MGFFQARWYGSIIEFFLAIGGRGGGLISCRILLGKGLMFSDLGIGRLCLCHYLELETNRVQP